MLPPGVAGKHFASLGVHPCQCTQNMHAMVRKLTSLVEWSGLIMRLYETVTRPSNKNKPLWVIWHIQGMGLGLEGTRWHQAQTFYLKELMIWLEV